MTTTATPNVMVTALGRYIPTRFTQAKGWNGSHTSVMVYIDPEMRHTYAFSGKSKKGKMYSHRSTEDLQRYIDRLIENAKRINKMKVDRIAERDQPTTLKVGDIVVDSWGYDQTQVDFYIVTEIVGKRTVKIRAAGATSGEATSWASDTVTCNGKPYGEEYTCRVTYGKYVNVTKAGGFGGHHTAHPYDGHPMHRSWYA